MANLDFRLPLSLLLVEEVPEPDTCPAPNFFVLEFPFLALLDVLNKYLGGELLELLLEPLEFLPLDRLPPVKFLLRATGSPRSQCDGDEAEQFHCSPLR